MLKKSASFVLASLRSSTYPTRRTSCLGSLGWAGEKSYASAQDTAASPTRRRAQTWCSLFVAPCASLRPRWTAILSILRVALHHLIHKITVGIELKLSFYASC